MIPNAPIENFRLPMFNEEGFKAWEIQGDKGLMVDDTNIELVRIRLQVFSGTAAKILETQITSPSAIMVINDNRVFGTESIRIENKNYLITGKKWQWTSDPKAIVIEEKVLVTFFQNIGDLLL
ncbi:MAG: LPS export ABC transporter periplasmic protein LptC [Opitutaceae bacterium]|nr:LPS export ABC transporter periplasmic protein LptC [Opitutaceae bacterium]